MSRLGTIGLAAIAGFWATGDTSITTIWLTGYCAILDNHFTVNLDILFPSSIISVTDNVTDCIPLWEVSVLVLGSTVQGYGWLIQDQSKISVARCRPLDHFLHPVLYLGL